ncbi:MULTISPECIES: hypothetical protein [unclassified Arthrobacter]|uniref:hypothetical protein n=1 Tax=Arthrobacter sp. N1 TaxID=619291 RepID=UPI003BAE979B
MNELGRAPAPGACPAPRLRGSRYDARPTRGAFTAALRADVVAVLRLQPPPTAALMWLGICVSVDLITPALPVLLARTIASALGIIA